jgi:peptidoglycan hydrolase CwlO-like protein
MENTPANTGAEIAPAATQPTTPITDQVASASPKKTSPWVWIVGGCLILIFLSLATVAFLGWLGYQAAKEEIKKQTPNMQEFKGKMEDLNKEAEKWNTEADKIQRKSQELQDSMPTPEDIESSMPARY